MSTGVVATVRSLLSRLFPERQFYHRSHGEVRFISLSARNQVGLAIVSLAFLSWVAYASVNVVFKKQIIDSTERRLKATQVEYEVRMSDMQSAYDELNALLSLAQERFEETTKELEAKHRQLETFMIRQASIQNNFGELRDRLSDHAAIGKKDEPKNTLLMQATDLEPTRRVSRMGLNDQDANLTHVSHVMRAVSNGRLDLHQETAQVSAKVTKLDGRLSQLNRDRSEQMAALEERASRSIEQYESYINTTELDMDKVLSRFETAETAVGGPLITLQNPGDVEQLENLDEYKRQLYRIDLKLAHLANLEAALSNMPLAMPTDENIRLSSPFGPRRDPFTRKAAFHSGLDIAGPRRSPIFATAPGKVVHAANKGPYGRMVEIDHGHGFKTRFGHLYRIKVNKGDNVDFGQTIGLLGSSGRANGPHVHYEVWFEGKVQDPKKFIKAGRHVLKS
jgi:murein DD-endopeptidase MepM/ murein hydrolase activator NlpD